MDREENSDFHDFFGNRVRERGVSLEKLSKASGIALKHLEALMRDDLDHLPAAPYLRGYITKLGQILDFDGESWWQHLKKETSIKRSGIKDEMPKNRFAKQEVKKVWVLGIIAVLIVLIFIIRLPYIFGEPVLTISSPVTETTNTTSSELMVSGHVKNGDALYINSSTITLQNDGGFSTTLSLQPGLNTVQFIAKKTLGREAAVTRQVFYDAPPAPSSTSSRTLVPSPATSTPAEIPLE